MSVKGNATHLAHPSIPAPFVDLSKGHEFWCGGVELKSNEESNWFYETTTVVSVLEAWSGCKNWVLRGHVVYL